jgi:preprotein translocase subunit SecF
VTPLERRDDRLRPVEIPGGQPILPDGDENPEVDDVGALDDEELEELEDLEEFEEDIESFEANQVATARAEAEHRGIVTRFVAPLRRLYRGETSFDFVGRRRLWFAISGAIIVAGLISFSIRGFNFGIDFKGGTSWQVYAPGVSQSAVQTAVSDAGLGQATVEILGGRTVEVQADLNSLSDAQQKALTAKVAAALKPFAGANQEVSISTVGPTWGGQVTSHALTALIAFFICVGIYISIRFEPKMAAAAFVALLHDLLVTAGVYSLAGFQVTPDTVVAILTILGYSLYDTVVVFDRVRDNTRNLGASGRITYSDMVNLSMNQTLARSINTSLVAILPVLAVLVIGAQILGAVTLQDYGLALFVGLLSGAYSSIFIASPILAMMKEREPRYIAIRQRLASRGERSMTLTPAAAAMLATGAAIPAASTSAGRSGGGPLRPGAARSAGSASAPRSSGSAPTVTVAPEEEITSARPSAPAPRPNGARRPPPRPRKGTKRGGKRR